MKSVSTAATNERRRRHRRGHLAERLCVWHLRLRGYRILAVRFRRAVGEIDIIARRGQVIAYIEVKARADFGLAAESVSWRQRQRVRRAAGAFLSANPALARCGQRFDVMLVKPWRAPRHVIDAWRD